MRLPPKDEGSTTVATPAEPGWRSAERARASSSLERTADEDDEPALRGDGARGVEDGAQAVVGSGRDPGEGLEAGLEGVVVVRPGVAARVAGEQVHGIAPRWTCAVTEAAVVTAHSSELLRPEPAWPPARVSSRTTARRLAGPVLLAHHQLAGAGGGGPVDAAQVVAVAVLADRLVVLAVQRDHVGDAPSAPRPLPSARPPGAVTTRGSTTKLVVRADRGGRRVRPNGSLDPHAERAEPVPPAQCERTAYSTAHVPRPQRRGHEAGRSPRA